MTDTPTPTPAPITLESALASLRAGIAMLTPDEQLRINYDLTNTLPLLLELVEGVEHPYFAKVPFVGGTIENVVDGAEAGAEAKVLAMLVPPAPAVAAAS